MITMKRALIASLLMAGALFGSYSLYANGPGDCTPANCEPSEACPPCCDTNCG